MREMSALVDELLGDPMGSARARAKAGERVVGCVGVDVPVELVTAAAAHAVRLPARIGAQTPMADRYLESSFAPALRSITEQWLSGGYDFLDAVILSRSDDGTQRLYYYLCELQRRKLAGGPRVLLYDIAKIARARSERHTLDATARLARELGGSIGALPDAIATRNRRRELLHELGLWRQSASPPLGTAVERVLRASDLDDSARFDEALSRWMREPRAVRSGARLLLAGSTPPDERLHAEVERAGGCVVAEFGDHSVHRLGEPIPSGKADPLERLARHYHALRQSPRAFFDRAAEIAEQARRGRAAGVVLWLIEEDESLAWDVPVIQQKLSSEGIALLTLTRCRWDASDGALDRVRQFVSGLRP
jgi:benzoyl-CoA reductase/2-hydroxyglutaryl-CoA dehydratase subunit BcrC/BadD/HgdB